MIVNGSEKKFDCDISIKELLDHLKLDFSLVVVEVNGKIMGQESFETHVLDQRDIIEIIGFVGGG